MSLSSPKLLFFVAVDWFFCSHFIERAKAAQRAGYEVVVVTHVAQHRAAIEAVGLRVISLAIDRRSLNPLAALLTLLQLVRIFRNEKPDLFHQVALKPILLGGLAARFTGGGRIINAVVGGGYVFTSMSPLMRAIRPLVQKALKYFLNPVGSVVVFENRDDMEDFVRAGQVRAEDAVLIRGAGVDPTLYKERLSHNSVPLVVVPARLLWDKGLGEFVEAARILRMAGIKARFALVGGADPGNRASIDSDVLDQWSKEAAVELWGFRNDMLKVFSEADIVCLPSYREGLPKALLEAMAAGLPCVTTDVPGCREAIRDGETGFLVPPKDPKALANALQVLIQDTALRKQMGRRGRVQALNEFSSSIICEQTLQLYKKLLLT